MPMAAKAMAHIGAPMLSSNIAHPRANTTMTTRRHRGWKNGWLVSKIFMTGSAFVETRAAGHLFQRAQAHRLVGDRIAYGWVLLSLDDEPAGIAVLGGDLQHRLEIHRAVRVARHGEHTAAHALQETEVFAAHLVHDVGAHILGVEMRHAAHVTAGKRQRIAAAEEGMAGIEQQPRFRAGIGYQPIDLFLGLDYGAHVVVIDERHA